MRVILNIFQALLMMGTFVASYIYYQNTNPMIDAAIQLPDWFYYFLGFGVLGVSAAWGLFHIIGGGIFGMAAGGILDGIRLGGMLGVALAVGRLWPYIMLWAAGAFFTGPAWHTISIFFAGLICAVINFLVHYIWNRMNA